LGFSGQLSASDCGDFIKAGRYQHNHSASNWAHHGTMMIENVYQCSEGTCFTGLWKIDEWGNTTNPVSGFWVDDQFTMRRNMGGEFQVWNGYCTPGLVQGTFSDMRWQGNFTIFK
jgi:hypothetical protein